jgi:hypothetical protein
MKQRKKVRHPLVLPAVVAVTMIAGGVAAVDCGGNVVVDNGDAGPVGGSGGTTTTSVTVSNGGGLA